MNRIKSAKIFFFFAVLLFVAKPFIGFSLYSCLNPPVASNIMVKAFTKRKQEYVENSGYDVNTVQKKLADPILQFILRFSFLLSILFSAVYASIAGITRRLARITQLVFTPPQRAYLLNSQLII